jgi:hypothetical protein
MIMLLVLGCGAEEVTLTEPLPVPRPLLAPTLELQVPEPGDVGTAAAPVRIAGVVSDGRDDPNKVRITWKSDLDGVLVEDVKVGDIRGRFAHEHLLSPGDHMLEVIATDPGHLSTSTLVKVTVTAENQPPTCAWTHPASGAVFDHVEGMTLVGEAHDPDGRDDALEVTLTSEPEWMQEPRLPDAGGRWSVDGSPTPGAYTMTMTATDAGGLSCTASTSFQVLWVPSVRIASSGTSADDLRCAIDREATFATAGGRHELEWTVEGRRGEGPLPTGATVPSEQTRVGETWTCRARGMTRARPGAWSDPASVKIGHARDLRIDALGDVVAGGLRSATWQGAFRQASLQDLHAHDDQKVVVVGTYAPSWEGSPAWLREGADEVRVLGGERPQHTAPNGRAAVWGTVLEGGAVLDADLILFVDDDFAP